MVWVSNRSIVGWVSISESALFAVAYRGRECVDHVLEPRVLL